MKVLLAILFGSLLVITPARAQTIKTQNLAAAQSSPGWIVDVFEHEQWKDLDASKDVLARIVVSPSQFKLDSHLKVLPASNLVFYRGNAVFKPSEAGRFTFYIVPTEGRGSCVEKLRIADRSVIDVSPPKFADKNQVAYGGAELEAQPYSIQFLVGCNGNNTTISIKVRGPQDMTPRDFAHSELFIVRK